MENSQATDIAQKNRLNVIYFYLTDDCNLRCRHCWLSPKYSSGGVSLSYLPFELYCSIIKEAKPLGLSSVKLTGGEPLLHPNIADILDFTIKEGIALSIETNGLLCTKEIAHKLAASKSPFISISLDGIDAETHEWVRGVKGSFDSAVAGIKNLVSEGLRPQIIMTIMRRNVSQMEAMVKFAESIGAGSVKFNVVQPTSRGKKMHEQDETPSVEELIKIGEWVENVLSRSAHVKIHFGHPLAFRPLGNMFGDRGGGCGVCGIKGIIGVLPDGSYALCGIGESMPELIFGNASRDKLELVWNGSSVINELRGSLPARLEGVCSNCLMKDICLGSCIAQNYYRSKSLWAPFWFCEEADKKGLFPISRLKKTLNQND